MKPRIQRYAVVCLLVAFICAACSDSETPIGPAPVQQNRIQIIDDPTVLARRVVEHEDLELDLDASVFDLLDESMSGPSASVAAAQAPKVKLKLRSEVAPPTVGTVQLEATHVTIRGPLAFVSYGKVGSLNVGAVDMFLVLDPKRPTLIGSVRLTDTDVFSVATDGLNLYCSETTSDTAFAGPATVERMGVSGNRFSVSTTRASVPGFAATALASGAGRLFVASGEQGGLNVLDGQTLQPIAFDPFTDARAVAYSNDWLVALQGGGGQLRVYDPRSFALIKTVRVGGLGIPGSKASVEIDGDYAYVGLGDGGMAVVDLAAGRVLATLPQPLMHGVASTDAVTNAVTSADGLVFMANGGSGVWVAANAGSPDGTPSLNLMGQIVFPGPVSSNFVAASGSTLFVAAGSGGLKILEIK